MMASNDSQLEAGNDSLHDDQCSLCEEEGQQIEATKFCKECCVYMCDSCVVTKHNKFPLNKRHQMLTQKQFSAVKEASLQSFPTRRCPKHPGEILNIFCGDHNVVCCLVCKALEHSTCAKSQHLSDAAKSIPVKGKEYQSVNKDIKTFISDVQKILHDRRTDITRVAETKQTIKDTIADFRKRKDKYFDDLEKKSLEELHEKEKTIVNDIEEDTKYLDNTRTEAGKVLQSLESFKGNNECEHFVLIKESQHLLGNARDKIRTISRSVNKDRLYYEFDPKIEEYLKSLEMMGSFTDAPVSICRLPETSSEQDTQTVVPKQLEIKSQGYKGLDFGMCALPDGTILTITFTSSQKEPMLTRYSKSNTMNGSVQVPGYFVTACEVDNGQVAVLYNQDVSMMKDDMTFRMGFVGFLCLGKTMFFNRVFSIGSPASGMAYNDGKLYVCCNKGHQNSTENLMSETLHEAYSSNYQLSRIAVYSIDGKLQRYIPEAPQWFHYALGNIVVCEDGQYVIVYNKTNVVIVMLDMSGNVVESFNQMNDVFCTDDRGHMLGCMNRTVVQVSLRNHDTKEILSKDYGITYPKAMCFDQRNSRLIVASSETKIQNMTNQTHHHGYGNSYSGPQYETTYTVHVFKLEPGRI